MSANPSPHQEFELTAGNPDAIIFIHGILGSPSQFRPLAEKIHRQGFDSKALLLPGHGGTAKAFYSTSCLKWSEYVYSQIDSMKAKYRNVYIIGHSLGGLLCLNYAAEHDIAGIVLINAPLAFKLSLKQLAFSAKILFTKAKQEDEFLTTYRQAFGVSTGKLYEYPLWLRQFIGLNTIVRQTRRRLKAVKARTLIIQSALDESVSQKSVEILKSGLSNAQTAFLRLEESYHGYITPNDHEKVLTAIVGFLGLTSFK